MIHWTPTDIILLNRFNWFENCQSESIVDTMNDINTVLFCILVAVMFVVIAIQRLLATLAAQGL